MKCCDLPTFGLRNNLPRFSFCSPRVSPTSAYASNTLSASFLNRSSPFHLPRFSRSFPFLFSPTFLNFCHDRQCYPRCSSLPFSPHFAFLGISSLAFLMVLGQSVASILEGGSSSRYVTVPQRIVVFPRSTPRRHTAVDNTKLV